MARTKKPPGSIFAKNLNDVLSQRNLSQNKAAKLAGVSLSTLHGWLAGASPSEMQAVLKLCKALDLDFQFLLSGERSGVSLSKIPLEDLFKIEANPALEGIYQVSFKKMERK